MTLADENNVATSPEIVEIDPALTNAPQRPIPSFTAMNGRWPSESSMSILDRMRQQGSNSRYFGSSLLQDLINTDNACDVSVSPDAGQSSDRPTPNSSTSASDLQNSASGKLTAGGSSSRSFETSPASSTAQQRDHMQQSNVVRTVHSMFGDISGQDGLAPNGQFVVPETAKDQAGGDRTDAAGAGAGDDFSWDSFAAGGTGMTPMSEGVLRTMLQMGPMETMDLGWDNPP